MNTESGKSVKFVLDWKKFGSMKLACKEVRQSCIYVIADSSGKPLYIGETGRTEGLDGRYHGGTASAFDAALHGSGNSIFVACVAAEGRSMVEKVLIYRERPPYNRRVTVSLTEVSCLEHKGKVPHFEYLKRQASSSL